MEPKKFKRGMVFGVFDGLHPGHRYFLTEAQKHCEKLVVVVAQDEIVFLLKQRLPKHNESERVKALQELSSALKVVLGDRELGSWEVLKLEEPTIIILGHDQQALAQELKKLNLPCIILPAHQPDKYKTSLLQ